MVNLIVKSINCNRLCPSQLHMCGTQVDIRLCRKWDSTFSWLRLPCELFLLSSILVRPSLISPARFNNLFLTLYPSFYLDFLIQWIINSGLDLDIYLHFKIFQKIVGFNQEIGLFSEYVRGKYTTADFLNNLI